MEFTTLPFEYEGRYADHYKDLGLDLEQAALLEQRDRDLEDYLASLSASGSKIPFYVAAADASDESKAVSNYVCTGTDDQDTIQQAVDDLVAYTTAAGLGEPTGISSPYGGLFSVQDNTRMFLSEGSFHLSGPVVVGAATAYHGGMSIIGAGRKTSQVYATTAGVKGFDLNGVGARVEHLGFAGFDYAVYDDDGLTNGGKITDCWFQDCDHAIFLDGGPNFVGVQGNLFLGCSTSVEVKYAAFVSISDNTFYDGDTVDIAWTELQVASIADNVSWAPAKFIAGLGFLSDVSITGNNVSNATLGIDIDGDGSNIAGLSIAGNAIVAGSPTSTDSGIVVDNTVGSSGDSPVHINGNRVLGNVRLAPRRLIATGNFVAGSVKVEDPCVQALVANNWIGDSEIHTTGTPTLTDSTTGTIVSTGAGNYLDGTWT